MFLAASPATIAAEVTVVWANKPGALRLAQLASSALAAEGCRARAAPVAVAARARRRSLCVIMPSPPKGRLVRLA